MVLHSLGVCSSIIGPLTVFVLFFLGGTDAFAQSPVSSPAAQQETMDATDQNKQLGDQIAQLRSQIARLKAAVQMQVSPTPLID